MCIKEDSLNMVVILTCLVVIYSGSCKHASLKSNQEVILTFHSVGVEGGSLLLPQNSHFLVHTQFLLLTNHVTVYMECKNSI